MHGDNNHYKSLVNNEAIDKKLFVSLALSKKFNHDGDNVLNPIIENGNLNNAILSEPLKIAYVGRLEEDKGANEIENIDQLIRIDWGFFVPILNSKMEYIENISSKKLFFDMENIELIKNLKNFNFLFFPSKSEGFGIAIVESMKNGVIPIVRDINSGVIAELQDGVNCIKYSDLEILHKKLKNILVNPSIYYDLKKNTYEFSISKFDNNKILHDFLNHINKIKYSLKKNYSNVRLPVIHYMPNSIFRIVKKIQNAFN
jgi:glycosyltransferase involved in cell wall biosynthesis